MRMAEVACPGIPGFASSSPAQSTLLSLSDDPTGTTKEDDRLVAFLEAPDRVVCGRRQKRNKTAVGGDSSKDDDERRYVFKHFEEAHRHILRYRFYHTVGGTGSFGLDPRELSIDLPGDSSKSITCKTENSEQRKQDRSDPTFLGDDKRCSANRSFSAPWRRKSASSSFKPSRRVYLTWDEYVHLCGPDAAPSPPRPVTSCNFRSDIETEQTVPCNRPHSQRLNRSNVKVNWRYAFHQNGCFTT